MAKQWFKVTWEMMVLAESSDEAEAKMQDFAMRADELLATRRYDDFRAEFDASSLKHSELENDGDEGEAFFQGLEGPTLCMSCADGRKGRWATEKP